MKHKRFGFTLIEVSLFLAITGLLFVGIAVGTQNSIFQQRFQDSVQNFAEFMRSIYAEVSNPQSAGDGRSDMAIYGKLITFGERVGLDGKDIPATEQKFFAYDVVARADMTGTGSVLEMLGQVQNPKTENANVVRFIEENGTKKVVAAGIVESYVPRWSAAIEKVGSNTAFTGSVLIVRHPRSGTVNTFVSEDVIQVNETIKNGSIATLQNLLVSQLGKFKSKEVDFCINPYGLNSKNDNRRDVRLVYNARNSSGVEIIDADDLSDTGNRCRKL